MSRHIRASHVKSTRNMAEKLASGEPITADRWVAIALTLCNDLEAADAEVRQFEAWWNESDSRAAELVTAIDAVLNAGPSNHHAQVESLRRIFEAKRSAPKQ